jgi:hypothetical protein
MGSNKINNKLFVSPACFILRTPYFNLRFSIAARVQRWLNQKCLSVILPAACANFHLVLQIYIRYISIHDQIIN